MKRDLARNKVYIDTSALIPFYFKEKFSPVVQQLFESDYFFCLSDLSKIEFYSSARKKVRMGDTTEAEIKKVFRLFDSHIDQQIFSIIDLNTNHFSSASEIIRSTSKPLRSLDAIHLGIAYSENLLVISYDNIFSETATEFGIEVITK
ncbi:MAG: type II toxin-antitoxin system VapC family toxin [Gracilimonas sp.]